MKQSNRRFVFIEVPRKDLLSNLLRLFNIKDRTKTVLEAVFPDDSRYESAPLAEVIFESPSLSIKDIEDYGKTN